MSAAKPGDDGPQARLDNLALQIRLLDMAGSAGAPGQPAGWHEVGRQLDRLIIEFRAAIRQARKPAEEWREFMLDLIDWTLLVADRKALESTIPTGTLDLEAGTEAIAARAAWRRSMPAKFPRLALALVGVSPEEPDRAPTADSAHADG